MATFTTHYALRKPAGGDFVTVSTDINANMDGLDTIIDLINTRVTALEPKHIAKMRRASTQSIGNAADEQLLFTSTPDSDPVGFGDDANDRFQVPVAGWYSIEFLVAWASNATGRRDVIIRKNAADFHTFRQPAMTGVVNTFQHGMIMDEFALNDSITFRVFQDSGGALNVQAGGAGSPTDCYVVMRYLRPLSS